MVRMEMCEEVVLALCVLKVEAINHEVGPTDPFYMLHLLCHVCYCVGFS